MPTITITLSDTPSGGVSVHSTFAPAVGASCSLAQQAALEMINRTRHAYGIAAEPSAQVVASENSIHQQPGDCL